MPQDASMIVGHRAAAAVGQSGLMALYDAMFAQYGVQISQVTEQIVYYVHCLHKLCYTDCGYESFLMNGRYFYLHSNNSIIVIEY